MQFRVRRQDGHTGLRVAVVIDGGDLAAGLGDEQDAGRHVPGLQIALVVGVEATAGDPGEVQSRRTQTTDAGDALADGVDVLDRLGVAGLADEGQTGGDQRFRQVATAGDGGADSGDQFGAASAVVEGAAGVAPFLLPPGLAIGPPGVTTPPC